MPRAGSGTVSTEAAVFQSNRSYVRDKAGAGGLITSPGDGQPCRSIRVNCTAASAVSLLARIPSLHNGTETATIPAGESREFINFDGANKVGAIDILYLTGSSGTATYTFEVIA